MTALLTCHQIGKSYGGRQLFNDISLTIHQDDRIGLIGPNGCGKSTFLKVMAGIDAADSGEVTRRKGITVGYVPQHPQYPDLPLEELLMRVAKDDPLPGGYDASTQVQITLGKMGFEDPQQQVSTLSGGWLKRLAIAHELVQWPSVLFLDEPTNHLDLESILWLEQFLQRANFGYLVISHDRRFLEAVSQKVMELNPRFPEGIFAVDGSYSRFLEKRGSFLEGQERFQQRLKSKVKREIEWLKRTPQARTTKSQSRIDEAHRLQGELVDVKARNAQKKGQLGFAATERKTKRLLTVKNVGKTLGGKTLFEKVDITLSPGMRLGIVGANGTGKSTLMRILCGELESDTGTRKLAEGLKLVVFDQKREKLPQDIPLRQALCPTGDTVRYRGQSIHVNAWCQRFLFEPERLDLPVNRLSGGEQARVLIARLMLEPADILFLDEPTNDLDISTLELLEESLLDFPGAVVLITHDRLMLDQVSTELIAVGPAGNGQFFADSFQWEAAQEAWREQQREKEKKVVKKEPSKAAPQKKRLSYKEKRELEGMEDAIMAQEAQVEELQERVNDPAIAADSDLLHAACQSLEEAQAELDRLYARWEELSQH